MPNLLTAPTVVFAQAEGGSSALGFLLPIAILGAVFYLLLVMPQRRRAKKAQALRESLGIGDEVRTIGGIYGTIRAEDDTTFTIEIDPGTKMRISKRAIAERTEDESE